MRSSEKVWANLSAIEKAMTYAAEYRANPGEYDSIHKHWLLVLADEVDRLSEALERIAQSGAEHPWGGPAAFARMVLAGSEESPSGTRRP